MSNVIPFPKPMSVAGVAVQGSAVRAGVRQAGRLGFTFDQIAAVAAYDRRMSAYLIGLLGSLDAEDQRAGEFGLRRLLASMENAA